MDVMLTVFLLRISEDGYVFVMMHLVFRGQDNTLSACCFTKAPWTTSKFYSNRRRRYRARRPVLSLKLSVHLRNSS